MRSPRTALPFIAWRCTSSIQSQLGERDDGGGVVSEENLLRYRLQIVQRIGDGPLNVAILTAIATRAEVLRETLVASPTC